MDDYKTCNKCKRNLDKSWFTSRRLPIKKDGSHGVSLKNNCKDCASIVRVCHKYDISEMQLLSLYETQQNCCKICKRPETTVDGRYGKVRTLSVDHCHKTGRVRGLLCEGCNRALGLMKDDVELLGKAIDYLKQAVSS